MDRGLMIGGIWTDGAGRVAVCDKYDGTFIDRVVAATEDDVDRAVVAAAAARQAMAAMPAHRRSAILSKTAELLAGAVDELGGLIAAEAGKALKHARIEVARAVDTFTCAAEEARRIHGETVPLDGFPSGDGYFGFWRRRPLGIVAAVTPFNFPLNLVAHKLAPAVAAGNTVVLKPASTTPLAALRLAELMLEAGLPAGALSVVCGPGATVGARLVAAPDVACVSFTGSADVGRDILARAGIKKVTLELGNNGPVVLDDAPDLQAVARRCAFGAFYYQGQVCISVQRIYVRRPLYEDFVAALTAAAKDLVVGDPKDGATDVGPMISEAEARRVEDWIARAVEAGAVVRTGGLRRGVVHEPTVLTDLRHDDRLSCTEAFGPVVAVWPYDDFDEALRRADDTVYGLQAGVYTSDVDRVLAALDGLDFGGVVVNDIPTFRSDPMPYGGNRQSGLGREGLRYAIEGMTNMQMVAIRRR